MNRQDRAKQFMPFDALKGLQEALRVREERRSRIEKKSLSEDMDKILKERRSYIANAAEGGDILPLTSSREEGVTAQVIVPIVSGGDCLGAVAVLSKEDGAKMDGGDMNLARLTADILANQFE